MVLGFLAIEAEGHIVTEAGKGDGGRGRERDALVRRAEKDVERDARGQRRARVEDAQLAQPLAVAEESRIEEVRGQAPGLGLELAEPQHARTDRELDELAPEVLHRGP